MRRLSVEVWIRTRVHPRLLTSADAWTCLHRHRSAWLKCLRRRRSAASPRCLRRRGNRWMCLLRRAAARASATAVARGVIAGRRLTRAAIREVGRRRDAGEIREATAERADAVETTLRAAREVRPARALDLDRRNGVETMVVEGDTTAIAISVIVKG